jgi:hypothetical protein
LTRVYVNRTRISNVDDDPSGSRRVVGVCGDPPVRP